MKDVMKQISIHQENGFRILPPEEAFFGMRECIHIFSFGTVKLKKINKFSNK